jgi:carbamoylphosphate synthase large subunit
MADIQSDKERKRMVLIGSSGAGNGFSSIMALRRTWGSSVKVVCLDSNPGHLVTASLLSDRFYQVPETLSPEFQPSLIKIIEEEDIDTYIPLIDEEIYIAALLQEEGKLKKETALQVISSEVADLCNDKYKTFLWLSENNILTPECIISCSDMAGQDNLILKPRKGYGSQIMSIPDDKTGIAGYDPEQHIIQQMCEKPEVTVDVCYSKNWNYFNYICRERIETKSGVCTKARLFHDKILENIAFLISERLDLCSFCFQVMKIDGDWAVTDINARLGAGSGMSVAAGMDFFSAMFAILWGEDPSVYFRAVQKEVYVTRQYCDFVMNI